ncbi:MAG TPA: peptidylprolyl isomerase, partial [Terricaulis sp.]|nr:peptidylprolyl isomerase [Terricaulis sp.]
MGGIFAAAALSLGLVGSALAQERPDARNWRELNPEDTLYIDTVHGRIVVEMYPEIAPAHVERIKT